MLSLAYQNLSCMTNPPFLKKSLHSTNKPHDESAFLEEIFALDKQTDAFPIAFDVISKAQLADKKIQQCITNNDPDFETRIIQ
jgi:hypothetical protein